MKIDLLKIITDAKNIYRACHAGGMCTAIRTSIILYIDLICNGNYRYFFHIDDRIRKTVHKPPKYYYPLSARGITPYNYGYWWKLNDVESRLKRFDEYIEYFKKPENRYLEV